MDVSPSLASQIVAQLPAIITSTGTLLVAIAGVRTLRKGQEKALVAAQEVKTTLAETHDKTEKKIDAIHTLVNSEHSTSLRLASRYADRIAKLTNDTADIQAATDALKAADDHDKQQRELNIKS